MSVGFFSFSYALFMFHKQFLGRVFMKKYVCMHWQLPKAKDGNVGSLIENTKSSADVNLIPLWNRMESGPGPTSNSLAVGCRRPWDKTLTVSAQIETSIELCSSCLMMRELLCTKKSKHTFWSFYEIIL